MYYMVIFVVSHPDECEGILDAWEAIGTPGITIIESSGLGQLRKQALRDDLPIMPNLQDLLRSKEVRHRTLFSVVEGEDKVDEIVKATREVVGDLDEENSGFLFALPVSKVYGLRKPKTKGDRE